MLDHAIDLNLIAVAVVMEVQGRIRPASLRSVLTEEELRQRVATADLQDDLQNLRI